MRSQRLILTMVLVLAGVAGLSPVARGAVRAAKPHCVVELDGRGGAKAFRCFDAFSDAVFFGTKGRVRISGNVRPQDLSDRLLK